MNNKPQSNLTGKQFGKLTVIEYVGNGKWRCQCECGKTIDTRTSRLKSGKRRSCNCKMGIDASKMLKPYVFESLTRHGNTVISNNTFEYYGEDALLDELHQHGFDCQIRISDVTGSKHIIIELIR